MCDYFPGDVVHYLSRECPALSDKLELTLKHSLDILASTPQSPLQPVLLALQKPALEFVSFILDSYTNPWVIRIRQEMGLEFIYPLFRLSRAYIWCMHRERQKILNQDAL